MRWTQLTLSLIVLTLTTQATADDIPPNTIYSVVERRPLVIAKLVHRKGHRSTWEVELVLGTGQHLGRQWQTFEQARQALTSLSSRIPRKIRGTFWQVGDQGAFEVNLQNNAETGTYDWLCVEAGGAIRLPDPTQALTKQQQRLIARLIDRLGSRSFRQRNQAQRQLMALRQLASASLREALKSKDLEVRRRARQLLTHLRQQTCQQIEARLRRILKPKLHHVVLW